MRIPEMEEALSRFFNDPENGIFKGPWLQLRRPFRLAIADGNQFFDLHVPFTPFKHQFEAWRRLTSKGNSPKPTIVTTGTGSGKTECFLYPVLDHCTREHEAGRTRGIKAIVLYPMNALASDQAGRFAEEILKSDQLSYELVKNGKKVRKAKIRVGLYTGRMQPGQEDKASDGDSTYREVQIIPSASPNGKPSYVAITNRDEMLANPPDVLLTNYKMLDYLLMRPKDQAIWQVNSENPELLNYLVLDELHTYDGAQGADVACLIRRLKERLQLPKGKLCVVGTSATIAGGDDETGDDPINRLCQFAESLFEEPISNDAVILEDRFAIHEITRKLDNNESLPAANDCVPREKETAPTYGQRMAPAFSGPAYPVDMDDDVLIALVKRNEITTEKLAALNDDTRWSLVVGEWIRSQPLFHSILKLTEDGVVRWDELLRLLSRDDFTLREVGNLEQRADVVMAFLSLVAQAKELRSGKAFPLVPTQVQLWLRELRRIGLLVSETPYFNWLDQPLADKKQMPVVHCTECGEAAWVGLLDPDLDSSIHQHTPGFGLDGDAQKIYQAWGFEHKPSDRLVILSHWAEGDAPLEKDGGDQMQLEGTRYYLAPNSLIVRTGPGLCPLTGESTFCVKVAHERRQRESDNQWYGVRRCPHCQTEDSLMFIGSRAATVASVAIDEVFGSTLNSDPKLLAFTDSVQDASHRAGFFSARTYHFSFRTALQHVIDEAGNTGLPIADVGTALMDYWSQPKPGRPGSEREVMATLIPPDLREYGAYLTYRNDPTAMSPSPSLRQAVIERLNWEATSEFSLMLTHGRTMEGQASAALGWDLAIVADTVANLRQRLPGISPALESIVDIDFTYWVLGFLYRARVRGALYHPYLDSYARQNYWGKYPFGKTVTGRETYPPAGKYKPRLLVTERDKYHDHVLAPSGTGSNAPWQIVWARRVLKPAVDDSTLVDLIGALLEAGEQAGLFYCAHSDGQKMFYALHYQAARLYGSGKKLVCAQSGDSLFRPGFEAKLWLNAPAMGYRDEYSHYEYAALNDRESYYVSRYRKGALRRVFAFEHTGLLTTEERESLEMQFNAGGHADDPNVLTATSTLEMGIDIGDLSTTMLCSVPPTVASYLQRIGRAGRSTGTALVLCVINQRPHDLFFYARPKELLNGDVEPPGCWLDATAVIVRQYLAFCFDTAVEQGVLIDLPGTGKQLIDEVLINHAGHIPSLIVWMTAHEADLQQRFIKRFSDDFVVGSDTPDEFMRETRSERLRERIEEAAQEFNIQRQLLANARNRLTDQKKKLDSNQDKDALAEIEREQKILSARTRKLGEISALEVLTEHGLLPNYAFPERGVRFSGTTYNQHANKPGQAKAKKEERLKNYEIVRSGASAIRELAPANHFYTHSHVFDVQQLELGTKSQPLLEEWAVCGQCGHMRTKSEVVKPDAVPACPQCGYDGIEGQTDQGQHRSCLPFHRSQSVSYMEYYDSLSGDRGEDRENEFYQLVTSFDHTIAQASGAVGDDSLPFGIEYRSAINMRELNTGYMGQSVDVAFGIDTKVPEGFDICNGCGVAVMPGKTRSDVLHRKSCPGRRLTDALQREGQSGSAYQWEQAWLYRELRSEAIRLLLPDVETADIDTLEAAIYLGMRLRFQGDPAHLLVKPQIIPDHQKGVTRHYLVLMDAVPGGTGFLKALYQQEDDQKRAGEGVVEVLTLAKNALETCECRRLQQTDDDTDGCYRCIRTYHMQHRSENISREIGISLLGNLIDASSRRVVKEAIDEIKIEALFGSVLEKRFVDKLQRWVEEQDGQWLETLINGKRGFRFVIGSPERGWELELQPQLGSVQGVSIACQPDFMLRCDDADIKPMAIFTDGFEFHVEPEKEECRLVDDVQKRRAILESGRFLVWSVTWNDLKDGEDDASLSFLQTPVVDHVLKGQAAKNLRSQGLPVPDIIGLTSNPWEQFKAYLSCPSDKSWTLLAEYTAGVALGSFAMQGKGIDVSALQQALEMWRTGFNPPAITDDGGDWLWWSSRISLTEDMLAYAQTEELSKYEFDRLRIALRLEDSHAERKKEKTFLQRWRQFLAMLNFFQFASNYTVFTTTEVVDGVAPDLQIDLGAGLTGEWEEVIGEAAGSLDPLIRAMASAGCNIPEVAYESEEVSQDAFAELAWPDGEQPIVLLIGDQGFFSEKWSAAGWKVVTDKDVMALGNAGIVAQLPK